ncbi:hypothetical protein OB955_09230 [Halobacteria archaeon AArc-m2/3/4]|uniref:Uncharacterized protein n=1 Tax=Natronoglomus mannanivorans TaxID=2979990 RepID=A0ABT2QDD0_9EURY|nr:hypothetical protein [Halobacteria archaeon AArc-m2/3/4]
MFSTTRDGETHAIRGIDTRDILLGYIGASSALSTVLAIAIGTGAI